MDELENLWLEYARSKTSSTKSKLILQYVPLVKYVVDHTALTLPYMLSKEDIISIGITGLISAIEKYDISRGVKFETYAIARIRGSIIDELRKLDWIPRTRRKKFRKIQDVYSKLENKLGRSATDKEVANEAGIAIDELNSILEDAETFSILSLEQTVPSADGEAKIKLSDLCTDHSAVDPKVTFEKKELLGVLSKGIEALPEQEKIVISLYYYENLIIKEISEILKLSTSRVSQIHTKAIFRLRAKISNFMSERKEIISINE